MKAKACARCRQSKLRCDSDVKAPDACSRCQSINRPCVFDRSFQYTSKSRRLLELEAEVKRLRHAADLAGTSNASSPGPNQPFQGQSVIGNAPLSQCLLHKSLGTVHLAAAQVTELFRVFFVQCHIYLPFSISNSPETIYEKCPLLFWVICAVASSTATMLELQPHIQAMVGQIVVSPPRSVEAVQALLVLCMWPFPFYSTLGDPSFLYSGIATQTGMQIGLHRPSLSQEFSSRRQVLDVADDVRKTTWMACFVVNQMQAGRLGVPLSIQADFTFLQSLETPGISASLIALCRISRLTAQFTTTIGASAQNLSGLMDAVIRIDMVRFFSSELDSLQRSHFLEMSQVIEIAFLTSRLQLWSFILHDDVPRSPDVIEFFCRAEKDATGLIQIASEKNLSRCPFHLARSVLYSAVVLIKILASPFASQPKVILDQIHLAGRALSSAVKIEDDHAQRWSRHLQKLSTLRDRKLTPPVRSRMAASLVYDAIRIMKEHMEVASSDRSLGPEADPFPEWMTMELSPGLLDLDGISWDELAGLI